MQEGAGASIRGQPPPPLEVMTGEALVISRAVRLGVEWHYINLQENAVLHAHYYHLGKAYEKARKLGFSKGWYYTTLDRAKYKLSPLIYYILRTVDGQIKYAA
jgi:hypothetical protein